MLARRPFSVPLSCLQIGSGPIRHRNYSLLEVEAESGAAVPQAGLDWGSLFRDPTLPLVLDLGCGAGRFGLLMGWNRGPAANVLSVDIHAAVGAPYVIIAGCAFWRRSCGRCCA